MADRIYIVCEGQSEGAFVKKILGPWFFEMTGYKCQLIPYIVITSTDEHAGKVYRGGINSYLKVKNDLLKCLSYNQPVSTMIDLFRMPSDFPGYADANSFADVTNRVSILESRLKDDILAARPDFRSDYLIPYVQVHEFEALFYCDLEVLKYEYVEEEEWEMIDQLISDVSGMNPEDINNGNETAPSKRLLNVLHYHKGETVVYPLELIGIEQMLKKCPHFQSWINHLINVSKI